MFNPRTSVRVDDTGTFFFMQPNFSAAKRAVRQVGDVVFTWSPDDVITFSMRNEYEVAIAALVAPRAIMHTWVDRISRGSRFWLGYDAASVRAELADGLRLDIRNGKFLNSLPPLRDRMDKAAMQRLTILRRAWRDQIQLRIRLSVFEGIGTQRRQDPVAAYRALDVSFWLPRQEAAFMWGSIRDCALDDLTLRRLEHLLSRHSNAPLTTQQYLMQFDALLKKNGSDVRRLAGVYSDHK
jgi:hypothetical protein